MSASFRNVPSVTLFSSAVSGATGATTVSGTFSTANCLTCALQVSWAAGTTGTSKVLWSNDGISFFDAGKTTANPANSASGFIIDFGQIAVQYIKVAITGVSGTGQINGYMSSKLI